MRSQLNGRWTQLEEVGPRHDFEGYILPVDPSSFCVSASWTPWGERALFYHILPPCFYLATGLKGTNLTWTETLKSRAKINQSFYLLNCFSQLFCHSEETLTNTAISRWFFFFKVTASCPSLEWVQWVQVNKRQSVYTVCHWAL